MTDNGYYAEHEQLDNLLKCAEVVIYGDPCEEGCGESDCVSCRASDQLDRHFHRGRFAYISELKTIDPQRANILTPQQRFNQLRDEAIEDRIIANLEALKPGEIKFPSRVMFADKHEEEIMCRVSEFERKVAETKALGGTPEHEELFAQLDADEISARAQLNMCLSHGVEPSRSLLALHTETLDSVLRCIAECGACADKAEKENDMSNLTSQQERDISALESLDRAAEFEREMSEIHASQLQRAVELRDSARSQAERFKRERDDARTELTRLRDVAEHGRALTELLEQLHRSRRQPKHLVAFDYSPEGMIASVADELDEVRVEVPGSPDAQRETGDVVATAFQLMINNGGCPLDQITQVARRMRERLDLVEKYGMDWSDAKEQLETLKTMTDAQISSWHANAEKVAK